MPASLTAPPARRFTGAWLALPESLRQRLALASTGWRHLTLAGAECLRLARDPANQWGRPSDLLDPSDLVDPSGQALDSARLSALAADILLWAFGENPLSGPLATEILSGTDLPLPEASRSVLAAVAEQWRAPTGRESGVAYFERLAARRDTAKLAEFLAAQIAKDPAGLFWRDKALALALYSGVHTAGEPGAAAQALEAAALDGLDRIPGLGPVACLLQAQQKFLRVETEGCLKKIAELGPVFGPGFPLARAGLALLRAGEDAAAVPLLRDALELAPWQASLALVAADVQSRQRQALCPPPGPVLVLLYTWNKAADLDATLASLFASELYGAQVLVLDNGSTDETPQVLSAWQGRAGQQLARVVLPVNIGAPAARNWLAATPQARAAQCLVYLDDDVELPMDWLGRLGAALQAHPEAGVVGCKVVDHQAPYLLQNVAGHLTIPQEAEQARADVDFQCLTPNPFRLGAAHLQGVDWGLFDFVGPCASVTGCCHLFRREALDAVGPFSLALGPSQYDDFERDLRMLATGRSAVYQGHLRVRHRKRSGLASQGADAASANAVGNRYKMQTMHPRAEIAGFLSDQALRLGEATAAAFAALDRAGEHS